MKKIYFHKLVAAGNDFILMDKVAPGILLKQVAREVCSRKYGVGADGLLVVTQSKRADISMRIFNPDGSEAEMCGNGARCAAYYCGRKSALIETKAGLVEAGVSGNLVSIKLTAPRKIQLDIPLKILGRKIKINFINTGVPHAVIFVHGIKDIDVFKIGRAVRYHRRFAPDGANVNFVQARDKSNIVVRTYERGVEDETLACGTGVAASALVTDSKLNQIGLRRMNVRTQGGEILKVYFNKENQRYTDVWLEGRVKKVCKGEYYV